MADLAQSKERLNTALKKLEDIVNNKLSALQAENMSLRAEIIQLKNQTTETPPSLSETATDEPEKFELSPPPQPEAAQEEPTRKESPQETDLSLNELKKLVGQS